MRSTKAGLVILLAFLIAGLGTVSAHAVHTALDDYVAAPDSSYAWSLYSTKPMYGLGGQPPQIGTIYTLKMTSQTWQSGKTSPDRSKWTHWITIARPYNAVPSACFMIIDGGSISSTPLDISEYAGISATLGISIAYLQYIPNEPLTFSDGVSRSEDSIIAYSYDKYLGLYGTANEDPTWPLLLPMVKSAVRGMDTIQAFLKQQENMDITDFVIGGASKRGWTTWLTAAVDPRVKAAVPIVIDILNMQRQLPHHKNAYSNYAPNDTAHHMYGGYSDAIHDYTQFNIFDRLPTPAGMSLGEIVDPLTYRDRLTMPKLIINSTGDQFFLPDGIKFYYNSLPGDNHVLYVPNSDHSLSVDTSHPEMLMNILSFVGAFVPGSGVSLPKFDWSFQPDGSTRVVMDETPDEVNVWQAHVETHRDFRLENVGAIWTSSPLTDPDGDGVYVASVPEPPTGWTGFYVSVKVNGIETCSGLRVVPDTYPDAVPPADAWPPAFENFLASPAAPQTGVPVTLSFDASEALAADPTVTVNGNPATLQSANGLSYVFSYTVLPSDPEGPANVKISGTDLAGNPGSTRYPNTLAVDNQPLTLTNVNAVPALGQIGTAVVIAFQASESLHGLPGVTVNGHTAALSTHSGLNYEYSYTIAADDPEGFADVQVVATDFTETAITPLFGDLLAVDNTPPLFSNLSALPAFATDGTQITLRFDVSEALSSDPFAVINGGASATLQNHSVTSYEFTYTVSHADAAGPVSVRVGGSDLLYHFGQITVGSVFVIDRTAPTFRNFNAIPGTAGGGTSVTITFDAGEALSSDPIVSVNGHGATFLDKTGLSYSYLYTVQPDDPDGPAAISVNGFDLAKNTGSSLSNGSLKIDQTAPTGTVSINDGAAYALTDAVKLACTFNDGAGSGVAQMRFSDDGTAWTDWIAAGALADHTLPPAEGNKTVYMQCQDGVGNISGVFSDSIILDTAPPTGAILINNNRSATNSPNVTLSLTWADGAGSGAARMRFSNDGATWSAWEPLAAAHPYTLPDGDGHKTVRVQYLDRANRRSLAFNDYIRLDTIPPTGSIVINGGALTTISPEVTLGLAWADAGDGVVSRMRFSDDGAHWTSWMPLSGSLLHLIPGGPGYQTVRVQYLDGANNYSVVYRDYIKVLAP